MTHHEFICGDAQQAMQTLPSESVHCIVTSPPYWGLRDYGVAGQLGSEDTPAEYIRELVQVSREMRRVLRNDGTLWLNLDDTYRDKQLLGIPWRVALALQAEGWYLRIDNVWDKPNGMRESVTDRPTRMHEYMFLLTKSSRYFCDMDAIREPYAESSRPGEIYIGLARKAYKTAMAQNPSDTKRRILESMRQRRGANKGSVWTIPVTPFHGAHFATFPPDLVLPCILAGTSKRGCCPECGAPYAREVVRTGHVNRREEAHAPNNCPTKTDSTGWAPVSVATDNWNPTCDCNARDSIPCTVLDPFGGSGTVSMVAQKLGRNSIYIDLNREYMDMAIKRCGLTEQRIFPIATYAVREVPA
jgi:DNA modification methylase